MRQSLELLCQWPCTGDPQLTTATLGEQSLRRCGETLRVLTLDQIADLHDQRTTRGCPKQRKVRSPGAKQCTIDSGVDDLDDESRIDRCEARSQLAGNGNHSRRPKDRFPHCGAQRPRPLEVTNVAAMRDQHVRSPNRACHTPRDQRCWHEVVSQHDVGLHAICRVCTLAPQPHVLAQRARQSGRALLNADHLHGATSLLQRRRLAHHEDAILRYLGRWDHVGDHEDAKRVVHGTYDAASIGRYAAQVADVAQLVELSPCKRVVRGSSPRVGLRIMLFPC